MMHKLTPALFVEVYTLIALFFSALITFLTGG